MDKKFYVSFEVARLLKEKGYDEECFSYYYDDGKEIDYSFCGGERNSTWEERCVSAPTKAEAIDWLDSKRMVVIVDISLSDETWIYSIYREGEHVYDSIISKESHLPTRLEAEEAAIIKALELL